MVNTFLREFAHGPSRVISQSFGRRYQKVSVTSRLLVTGHNHYLMFTHLRISLSARRQAKTLFEEEFWRTFRANTTSMKPLTVEDPNWNPVIGIEYHNIEAVTGQLCPAVAVVYRKSYRPGEIIVVGRFCLPVRRGLVEVIIEAQDRGVAWREASVGAELCSDSVLTADLLRSMLMGNTFDDAEYDDQFPTHCLSRVRKSLQWLIMDSGLVVTEPPSESSRSSSTSNEISLPHLGCTIRPPPRFMFCPNLSNPESNKQRFYRATLGSEDVRMLVVSVWHTHSYAPNLRKRGIDSLRQIAQHGAQLIHHSQNFRRINVTVENLPVTRRTSWLGASNGRDAVITVVDCEESGGLRCQNTIGWIRDEYSELIYLIYYADTLGVNQLETRTELVECLLSLRGIATGSHYSGRRRSSQSMWNIDLAGPQLRGAAPSS